jgi:superfamily II DNA or RNA helicase
MTHNIVAGDIVSGLEPDEHVEIRQIKPFGAKTLIEGVTVTSRREIRRPLSAEELGRLVKVRGSEYTFDGDAGAFMLGVEAHRIRIAYQFDPLFAVNSSVVDVLPHQVEAVYRYLLPLPRIRFLLADDTGAGKTIMAGLLIKELLFRGVISKVLIITPGGLTKQWQEDEMRAKFGLEFDLVNRASFEAKPGQFSQSDEGLFVTSIDFISRNEGCLNAARETQWDMIVVDEAHKLSAFEYGTKIDRSNRYQAIEALAPRTDHLIFLTATPHRGRKDTFRRLLMLLDEDLFQKDELVTERIHEAVATFTGAETFEGEAAISKARNRFFLRRLKEEMVDWEGGKLFKLRHTKTTGYELTPEELDLYNAVTKYVRSKRKQAKERKNRNVELTLMVMQRRLASSIYAITRTLQNRLDALNEVLTILKDPNRVSERRRILNGNNEDIPDNIEGYEELDENQREGVDKRIFRQVLSDKPEDVEKEIREVKALVDIAVALKDHPEEKFQQLLKVLDESNVIRDDEEKLVIFTEHRDTLKNLTERLVRRGYIVETIHGGMNVDERKQAQRNFKKKAKIMVATDAAGEGINLQFCRYMINWDIPWNPNRLEQRMGRIHRYGQKDDVWVYNVVATNTREGAVLEKLLRKMDVMRDQMGNDRVYDVIDDLLEDVPLVDLIEHSIDSETGREAAAEMERRMSADLDQRAENLIALQKKQSLASHLDLREARRLRDTSDEHRLQPMFIQRFFTTAYQAAGGTISEDRHFPVFHLGRTPAAVKEAARKDRLSVSDKYDEPFVFDKELVSVASRTSVPENTRLLGPGHPLFDAVIEWAIRRARDSFARGATLIDPNIAKPERVWLVNSSVQDERIEEKKRLAHQQLSMVIADHLGLRATSPANMLNFTAPDGMTEKPVVPEHSLEEIQMWSFENLTEKQKAEVEAHRIEECNLRRTYLTDTFTNLILDLTEQLNDYQQAELLGDDEGEAEERQKLEKRIEQLKNRKQERLAELDLMLRLSANLPEVLTSALVVPAPVATMDEGTEPRHGVAMRRDDEVEQIAMDVVMRFERGRGWAPFDVHLDGEHYDIRSEAPSGEVRFIEVKGRAESGAVMLTSPEVDKLRQLGERAFLYIVTQCRGEKPSLRIIQDPMSQLSPEMLYRQVQYLVDEKDWKQKGADAAL